MKLPLKERITSSDELRSWKDQIPFHYEYTAGVAGERFLRGLQRGEIIASHCTNCGRSYLPPKTYCVHCYLEINRYRRVGPTGTVTAITEAYVDFDGKKMPTPRTFVFVTFRGVTGGLIHRSAGKNVAIGSKVAPRFRPASSREGNLLDIEGFARVQATPSRT